ASSHPGVALPIRPSALIAEKVRPSLRPPAPRSLSTTGFATPAAAVPATARTVTATRALRTASILEHAVVDDVAAGVDAQHPRPCRPAPRRAGDEQIAIVRDRDCPGDFVLLAVRARPHDLTLHIEPCHGQLPGVSRGHHAVLGRGHCTQL